MRERNHIERALLEQYILGLTTEEECKEIEQYLAQNPVVAKEVEESQAAIERFAFDYAMDPPARLKGDVIKAVKHNNSTKLQEETSILNFNWITGIAATLALGFGLLTFLLYQQKAQLNNQIAALENKVNQLETSKVKLVNQQGKIAQQFTLLKDVSTNHVHLQGTELSPKALFVVYWNEATQTAYLNMVGLPEIPTDKTLQLWADVAGEMIDMGVLKPNTEDLIKVPFIKDAESLNITLEPQGGSQRPTVERLYANGKML